jgi:hypothetical protein
MSIVGTGHNRQGRRGTVVAALRAPPMPVRRACLFTA